MTFKTTLLVMTLNEVDGMKVIMPQINKDWCEQIIIVDSGSTNGTIEQARDNGYEVYVQKQNTKFNIFHMIISRTPFRISFFGGGTDYPVQFGEHGGAGLGTSISLAYRKIYNRVLFKLFLQINFNVKQNFSWFNAD